jgi:hypothetical protein
VIADGDAAELGRMAAAAARARAATGRDVLWAGQASRRATAGRSAIGTVVRSSRNGLVSTRGSTATGHVAIGTWIAGTPGAPEGAPVREPDDIARRYWDLHTRREPAEHLISA